MQRIAILGALLLIPLLAACGKFADKFSRINGSFTRVYFSGREDSLVPATVDGGVMIYFDSSDGGGRAFGFSNKEAINTKSVVLPNGQYRVYVYGWDGAGILQGQTRCGTGDNGALLTLSGASTTVTINLDPGNCGFGTLNSFGQAEQGTGGNFDTMSLVLCTGSATSCTAASGGTFYVKAELLGGGKDGSATFAETSAYSLASSCSSGGSPSGIATNFRLPVGGNQISPPMRISVFTNGSCSGTASGTYDFLGGIRQFISPASGSSYLVELPASSTIFNLKVNKYF